MALETYDDPDLLYIARGEEVNRNRPLFTGDVFQDVEIGGIPEPGLAIVVAHPCGFRSGTKLHPTILMAPVVQSEQPIGASAWTKGYFNRMMLPRLQGEGLWLADFDSLGRAKTPALDGSLRIACLSEVGLNLLQQRLTYYLTRAEIETYVFHDAFSQFVEEADLLEEWTNTLTDSGYTGEEAVALFEKFIRSGTPMRQAELRNKQRRSAIRAESRNEAAKLSAAKEA